MAYDLSRVGERERLRPQREPYWHRLRSGCFVGFRPSKKGGKGTWVARAYDEDAKRYQLKALGDFGTLVGSEIFAAAKKEAEAHAELIESGGWVSVELETVADACRAYSKNRPEADSRFTRYVYDDPIANVRLIKLRRRHVREWRERLEAKPALVSRRKVGEHVFRKRAPSTVNRDMAVLRAALTKVLPPGAPGSEAAWQEALRAVRNADGRRTLYLDRDERRRLLTEVDKDALPFLRGLCQLPLRPGALAALSVGDFDARTSELTIGKDKAGKPRRIQLPRETAKMFVQQVVGRSPNLPLFAQSNGKAWDKNSWILPVKAAAAAAGLPDSTCAYTLRHSTITDLVRAGLPLLTIAQISGTSAEMIERHYGHLANGAALKALAELSI